MSDDGHAPNAEYPKSLKTQLSLAETVRGVGSQLLDDAKPPQGTATQKALQRDTSQPHNSQAATADGSVLGEERKDATRQSERNKMKVTKQSRLRPKKVKLQQPASLVEAEERAGYASWAMRGELSRLIDVAITRQWISDKWERQLIEEVRAETKSTSVFLDASYGGTTAVLSFDEAEMAGDVIQALAKRGVALTVKKPNGGRVVFKMVG